MKIINTAILAWALVLTACQATDQTTSTPANANPNGLLQAHFEWFDYAGNDDYFKTPLAENQYRNPILAGYHPDPSVVRVGEDFYLVNSTFGFYPGIPVFHSRDLVNWTQIGNAIHRPDQLNFDGIHLGYHGVYAATIEYRDGTFYVINTCVGCGGNFVVTATDPAGPWSDPIWMPDMQGIDPSIFFDDDGKTYVVHQRVPEQKNFDAHSAVWVMEVDPETFQPRSDDVMLMDGGADSPWNTDYLEGPHIYKINGTYYLSAPGGGTGYYHQQLLYKSDTVFGPYTPNPNNPVLTQFGLADDREFPVTATGHADIFSDSKGNWWAVFLATRVYDLAAPNQDPGNFHTGRETFLLPVKWVDGWPVILDKGLPVPSAVNKPDLPPAPAAPRAMTGNFSVHETFTNKTLAPHWQMMRTPHRQWWHTGNGGLVLDARADRPGHKQQPSFIGRRLAHQTATFSTKMDFQPRAPGDQAGLLAIQNDEHFYSFVLTLDEHGKTVVEVYSRSGASDPASGQRLARSAVSLKPGAPLYLQMAVDKAELDFSYSLDGKHFTTLLDNADSRVLGSAVAGGFTGAVVGMYTAGSTEE